MDFFVQVILSNDKGLFLAALLVKIESVERFNNLVFFTIHYFTQTQLFNH